VAHGIEGEKDTVVGLQSSWLKSDLRIAAGLPQFEQVPGVRGLQGIPQPFWKDFSSSVADAVPQPTVNSPS
jgi:hypothetical protein